MQSSDRRLLHSPSAARNQDAILDVLRTELSGRRPGLVLEIASGSGQHIVHFAAALKQWQWQPSEPEPASLASVSARVEASNLGNVHAPLALDVCQASWPVSSADIVFCANMIHIAPWQCTQALVAGAAQVLGNDGALILYGPFLRDVVQTAPGNVSFDASLRARNPQWGIRSLETVTRLAGEHGFDAPSIRAMPANNLTVVFPRAV